MPELLLEILSEEIPARMQAKAAVDLKRLVCDRVKAAGLTFTGAAAFVTPRRLALVVEGLPERQPDATEEKKGPKVGAPDAAVAGFLKASDLASIDEAEVRETAKGPVYFAVRHVRGQPAEDVLPGLLAEAIRACPWPKSMRWAGSFRWVRPLHRILALFAGRTLPGGLDLGGGRFVAFGNKTVGHRFLAPAPFEVTDFADYERKLRKAKVILDREERKAIIAAEAAKLAKAERLALKDDPELLEELAGLVEWPQVLTGRIDAAFMDLPPEVLATTMRSHQKYLATLDREGKLADRFAFVANLPARKGSKRADNIVAGNERVLRARLADARFFWDQDRKRSLASHVTGLSQMVFHAELGSLDAKVDRVQALATHLARKIPGADIDRVRSAARLAKADLTSGMVGEFPELQGIMGRYYALADGEHPDVAEAIAEHYGPLGPNDRCPSAPVSVAVALADKLDTLVGFWAIGEPPTGSKDPYALRRAALGVIRLIVENGLRLPLTPVIETARDLYRHLAGPAITASLLDFFADRLKVALRDKGVRHDLIAAVFALGGEDDLVRLLARVEALQDFLNSEDGENLLTAYKRAENIVRIEEKRDKSSYRAGLRSEILVDPVEKTLAERLDEATGGAREALGSEDYALAMEAMAKLRRPVDEFFDHVMVNTEDAELRANRLRLLSAIGDTLGQVADFSRIEG
ncbi:MAG: glycine--tRNA ligase subunit beta [Kiloniellales bacterium]|nr:glycine--tRNA ligase subunit beta [Kiloniellales bacterium]